ncbi:hypothetical protein HYALB_00001440 [Hymenoscyphus albidus]|uniref:Uncharacterized protein n=1 Tax=Hymenoscyphus albidus TaxID=595503 RepID=A0A9N9LF95_9HELO|nr:hypothetical protein HYALB_00001440 [Hymenoscyphus albidus]
MEQLPRESNFLCGATRDHCLVGGTPQGKATVSSPSGGFNNSDLASYFSRTASIPLRAPTPGRVMPSSTSSGKTPRKLSTGAIAGIAVAGAVVLFALPLSERGLSIFAVVFDGPATGSC